MTDYNNQDILDILANPDSVQIQSRTIDGAQWRCKVYYKNNRRHTEIMEREWYSSKE